MPIVKSKYRGRIEYFLVHSELTTAARYRGHVTYQELADRLGLPLKGSHMGSQVGHVLGEISEDEVAQGRPMLSAVALSVAGQPGSGFFELARELGLLKGNTREEEQEFWRETRQKLYATWQRRLYGTK